MTSPVSTYASLLWSLRALTLGSVALCAMAAAPQARAQTPTADIVRARELFDNGSVLYDEGNYPAAIVAFQESYGLSRSPLLLYNIANCHERLGQLKEARDALNLYRAVAPAEERVALERRIANIEERIASQAEVAAPAVSSALSGAPVSVATSAPATAAGAGDPAPAQRRSAKRPLIIGGAAAVAAGAGLAVYGYLDAGAAIDVGDRDGYDRARLINGVGYGLGGVGLAAVVVGVVLPGQAVAMTVSPGPNNIHLNFSTRW